MMLYKNKTSNNARKSVLVVFSAITLSAVLLLQSNSIALAQNKKETRERAEPIFTSVEFPPVFPGGIDALNQYLANNIHYPEAAKKSNIQGKAIIKFIVDKSGQVRDVEIKRDVPMGCGQEAKRVVAAMPKWGPGLQNGKQVNVEYILPINFQLQK